MTKKEIITRLREMGYKTNYKNTLVTMFEAKGYVVFCGKNGVQKIYLEKVE